MPPDRRLRGGRDRHPGILWSDFKGFRCIPGFRQTFGHSQGREVRKWCLGNCESICLGTTARHGWHHYAVIEGSAATICESRTAPP